MPPGLQERLTYVWTQLQLDTQLHDLKAARLARPRDLTAPTAEALRQLQRLRADRSDRRVGVGDRESLVGVRSIVGNWARWSDWWPRHPRSGETEHDQVITRAGNVHVRRVIVQLARAGSRPTGPAVMTNSGYPVVVYSDERMDDCRRAARLDTRAERRWPLWPKWRPSRTQS